MLPSGRARCELEFILLRSFCCLSREIAHLPRPGDPIRNIGACGRHGPLSRTSLGWHTVSGPGTQYAPMPTRVDCKPEKKGESQMRIIGIDLAVTAKHRAIIARQDGKFISPIIKFETRLDELDDLLRRAQRETESDCPLVVVMEATNIVWYPITAYSLAAVMPSGSKRKAQRHPECAATSARAVLAVMSRQARQHGSL